MAGYVWMRSVEIPRNWQDITLGSNVALDTGVTLLCSGVITGDKLVISSGTYVNRYSMFDAHQQIVVGSNCLFGPNCYITDSNHSFEANLSINIQKMQSNPIVIEDEVWIGAHVTILSGVRIGKGAVIGAGSVVTSEVPSMAIAVGVPAKVIKYRS